MNLLLKDNADDIAAALDHKEQSWIADLRQEMAGLVSKYQGDRLVSEAVSITAEEMSQQYDFAFIALHGRPGEDGQLKQLFENYDIPYNGSGWESASVTIDKYETGRRLREHGISTAKQVLIEKDQGFSGQMEAFTYPLIAKPVDDGCSSAVKLIRDEHELQTYLKAIFRDEDNVSEELRVALGLLDKEEFPRKKQVLIEERIESNGAERFLEITGGLMTEMASDGSRKYTIFHPSEAVASLGILSLEEKFLAGEGTNITPPRYHNEAQKSAEIGEKVKAELLKVAKILDIEGYARIDAFVRIIKQRNVELIVIEVNSLPGMTPATAIFHQAALEKLKPLDFIDHIIEYGLQKAAYERG
jgi:D-alanine-D-alanine ligase